MIGNPKCKSPKHPLHICALKEGGLSSEGCRQIAGLAGNPQFRCQTCGATANRPENLCNPKKI